MTVPPLNTVLLKAVTPVDDEPVPSSWQPVDLTDALNGIDVPPPTLFTRTDGLHLLYPGRTHWVQGESETQKSFGMQFAGAQVLEAGGRVLYIDFEDDARGVVSRLLALSVGREAIEKGFTYIRPDEPLYDRDDRITPGGVDLSAVLDGEPYDLAVIDGVTEAMTTEGLELNSNADVATWMRRTAKRIASTGAAVVCIDHVTKSREDRGRHAIGAQHKLSGVTGAAYSFNLIRPLARSTSKPITGAVAITVVKDRPGHIRGQTSDGKVGVLELTSYPDGGVTGRIVPASGEPAPDPAVMRAILERLKTYDNDTFSNIEKNVTGKSDRIRSALTWAINKGWIEVTRAGNSHRHNLTDSGWEQLR